MALYVVTQPNDYYNLGSYVECFDDGCQLAKVITENNKLKVIGHTGLLLPESAVRKYFTRLKTPQLNFNYG